MLIVDHKISGNGTAQAVWKIVSNAKTWPQWDKELEWVTFNGPFVKKTTGSMKPKNAPKAHFTLTECIPNHLFSTVTQLPLTKLIFTQKLTENNGIVTIHHHVETRGFFAMPFAFLIGSKIKKHMPEAMEKLLSMANQQQPTLD